MQTRKQWLLSQGHIQESQAGRGRISAENMALIQEAYKSGTRFSDWEPDKTEIRNGEEVTVKSVLPRAAPKIVSEFTILYPENQFRAVESDNTERSMRSACNNCGVSLVQCTCGAPTIVNGDGSGSVLVSIVRK